MYNINDYSITEQAVPTNRVFPGWWGDAKDGEEYISEWSAPATYKDGREVIIKWLFNEIRGQEEDPEFLDWSDIYSVEIEFYAD